MYENAILFLEPYVHRYKIREYDSRMLLTNKPTNLFLKLLETKKEIMISSEFSPQNCKWYDNDQIKWLYCVPKYPCKFRRNRFYASQIF